ncbi:MAG: mechanosensitive ion channel [Myxococcales bacterium]|nr:mechanosensitive ion channel [Myxococcales bacterium]MCB9731437.1 mechanosensitive ion channel [Deltaproteobacteria bacterium]
MNPDALFGAAWPWLWPSLLFLAWIVLLAVLRRTVRRLARQHTDRLSRLRVGDRVISGLWTVITLAGVLLGLYFWALAVDLPPDVKAVIRHDATPWVTATLLLIGFVAAGFYAVRKGLDAAARRFVGPDSVLDERFAQALTRPLYLTVILLGVTLWAALVPIPAAVAYYIKKGSETTIIILIVLLADGVAEAWMVARTDRSKVLKTSGVVLRTALRAAFYIVGALMALSSLGLDVTPILASLGVTSIAIGLALQGTLEDFLAGLLLAADQPIAVGDFVELEGEQAGVVLSIGWRTTRILTRDDMHVIVPNSKLAKTTLVNRSRPRESCKFKASCGVSYSSDLDHVARVALDVAQTVQDGDPRGVSGFKPRVVFHNFGDSAIEFWVWLCARTWEDHFGLQDNFIRTLHKRFDRERIVIPFPIRTLDVPKGTALRIEHIDHAHEGARRDGGAAGDPPTPPDPERPREVQDRPRPLP